MPAISKERYLDQEALAEAERQRFSLLDPHSDIVIRREDVAEW